MSAEAPHLPLPQIRPRFQMALPIGPKEAIDKIRQGLKAPDASCTGSANQGYATLHIFEKDRHYWSPQLSLSVEESESGDGCLLRGLYGPSPAVWTMFIFFYAIIGLAIMVVLLIGMSYYTLDRPVTILWWVPVLLLVFSSLYLVSYLGQRRGHDQMETLHHFLQKCLERPIR